MLYVPANQSVGVDSRLSMLDAACENWIDGAVRLLDLNLHAAKTAMMDAALVSRYALGQRPGWELCLEGARFGQAQVARAFSYGNEVAGIVGGVHGRLATLVREGALAGIPALPALEMSGAGNRSGA